MASVHADKEADEELRHEGEADNGLRKPSVLREHGEVARKHGKEGPEDKSAEACSKRDFALEGVVLCLVYLNLFLFKRWLICTLHNINLF